MGYSVGGKDKPDGDWVTGDITARFTGCTVRPVLMATGLVNGLW